MVTLIPENDANKGRSVLLIYILYLLGLLTGYLTNVAGLIIAYINIDDQPEWLQTHYRYQIRTFWIGTLYGAISAILMLVFIGNILMFAAIIWLIIRCGKGMKLLDARRPIPDPGTWLW